MQYWDIRVRGYEGVAVFEESAFQAFAGVVSGCEPLASVLIELWFHAVNSAVEIMGCGFEYFHSQ